MIFERFLDFTDSLYICFSLLFFSSRKGHADMLFTRGSSRGIMSYDVHHQHKNQGEYMCPENSLGREVGIGHLSVP